MIKEYFTNFDIDAMFPFFTHYNYVPFSLLFVGTLFFISAYLLFFRFTKLTRKYRILLYMNVIMTLGYFPCQIIYQYALKIPKTHLVITMITESMAATALIYCMVVFYSEKRHRG